MPRSYALRQMHELPLLSPYVEGRDAMNKNVLAAGLTAVALVWSAVVALAQQFGTAPEARAMLDRAVTELKSNEAAALVLFQRLRRKVHGTSESEHHGYRRAGAQ